jgi:transcriptional regulator with XRE-family HTH domain
LCIAPFLDNFWGIDEQKIGQRVDESVLQRLAAAVLEARGDLSQRKFANLLGVSQSTIQSWENGRNTPNLENLERLARIRSQLPEDLVGYLYGRDKNKGQMDLQDIRARIAVMSCPDIGELSRAIADRLSGL